MTKLNTTYNPAEIEERRQSMWQEAGIYQAPVGGDNKTFSIVMPPPNVTGALHMGHALDNTIQDVLTRWKRMEGYDTLWLPGTDHAGIATQIKVEEDLRKENLTRHDLGREAFLERVWQWKELCRVRIVGQLSKLGISCDWSRERFTLDEGCSRAVREVFVRLYEKGLIYRGEYIVNWCPRCETALSDIEVEHQEAETSLWHIKYPLTDGSGFVVVATTRPETMLGDTAVAVHPEDARYRTIIGKTVTLPVLYREIPIIADEHVDPGFGTGAVKVTPAHDPNDFEIGLRHNLPQVKVIDLTGTMTDKSGPFAGMDRYQCRKELVAKLEKMGALVEQKAHIHAAGHCQRCDTVIEPLVSRQWFVKMKPLAEPAIQAVQKGDTEFVPPRFAKTYYRWLENIRDWCISRQIWWGHRIPAWYCECGETIVAMDVPTNCPSCQGDKLTRDKDVLDTWFSSALWPFSTMGWPDADAGDLQKYFPTSVLVTGYDIIFFWVARMIFTSLEFTNQAPFKHVYIHGLIRDEQGRKMSKSLGNGIDPLEIIEKYGADTLRFTLLTGAAPGNDIRFQQDRVEASRNFANKIWNAARFVLMNLEGAHVSSHAGPFDIASGWILSRLDMAIEEVTSSLNQFELGEAARVIYEFLWNEFCDWYIEAAKPALYGPDQDKKAATLAVLREVLGKAMQLLHPIMPFITEEIWQQLYPEAGSIALSAWPERTGISQGQAFEQIMELVRAIRNIRSEMNLQPGKKINALIYTELDIENLKPLACSLTGLESLTVASGDKPREAVGRVLGFGEVLIPLAGLIDISQEIARLQKELTVLQGEVERIEKKLANPGFTGKAPAEVIAGEKEKLTGYMAKRAAVKQRLSELQQ